MHNGRAAREGKEVEDPSEAADTLNDDAARTHANRRLELLRTHACTSSLLHCAHTLTSEYVVLQDTPSTDDTRRLAAEQFRVDQPVEES